MCIALGRTRSRFHLAFSVTVVNMKNGFEHTSSLLSRLLSLSPPLEEYEEHIASTHPSREQKSRSSSENASTLLIITHFTQR